MKYIIEQTNQFKKDIKSLLKQKKNIEGIKHVVDILANDKALDPVYRDHQLKNAGAIRECHVENDLLLVYRKEKSKLILLLIRAGTHSEILEDISLKRFK